MYGIEIFKDYQGASLGEWGWKGETLHVALKREPVCWADGKELDYNLHFNFGLHNTSAQSAQFNVEVERHNGDASLEAADLYSSADFSCDLKVDAREAKTDGVRYFAFAVSLEAGERRIVSNTLMRPYAYLSQRFDRIGAEGQAGRGVLGRSVEGREIVAYTWQGKGWSADRPTLLITSGFHPPEPDTLATEEIMNMLRSPEGRNLIEGMRVIVVPICNPDGFAHGYNGCNVHGINFFWDFRYRDENCPEASGLWRFIEGIRPWVYLDFHCYTIQGARKRAGPYLKPVSFYQNAGWRRLAERIHEGLMDIPDSTSHIMCAPSSLSQIIVEKMNTISIAKYHLHLGERAENCGKRGVNVAERILACLREAVSAGLKGKLLRPYGSLRREVLRSVVRRMRIARVYGIRHGVKG